MGELVCTRSPPLDWISRIDGGGREIPLEFRNEDVGLGEGSGALIVVVSVAILDFGKIVRSLRIINNVNEGSKRGEIERRTRPRFAFGPLLSSGRVTRSE